MENERLKWPESLPPFVEVIKGAPRVNLTPYDLAAEEALQDLVHDLYWFPDREYFVYFLYGEGIGRKLDRRLQQRGVERKKVEMYFYKHQEPAYENHFVRALPGAEVPPSVKEATKTQMYGRVQLSLSVTMRKQLDLVETARATSTAISNAEPVVQAKPNFFGMGLNLNSLWRRLKNWWLRNRNP